MGPSEQVMQVKWISKTSWASHSPHSASFSMARVLRQSCGDRKACSSQAEIMRTPGVEPGSQAWKACMMPLHYVRSRSHLHDHGGSLVCTASVHPTQLKLESPRLSCPKLQSVTRSTGAVLPAEVNTPFSRGSITRSTRGGTRTHNLLLRREAPYPLGHTSC